MFGKKGTIIVEKVEMECCQCWKKFGYVHLTPGKNLESYKDMYHICPACFASLALKASDNKKIFMEEFAEEAKKNKKG